MRKSTSDIRIKELVKRTLPKFAVEALRNLKVMAFSRNQAIGMTSKTEQEFYRKCTRELSHLDGAIVDLGCWMGSTTISLAQGIREKKQIEDNEFTRMTNLFGKTGWMPTKLSSRERTKKVIHS